MDEFKVIEIKKSVFENHFLNYRKEVSDTLF